MALSIGRFAYAGWGSCCPQDITGKTFELSACLAGGVVYSFVLDDDGLGFFNLAYKL